MCIAIFKEVIINRVKINVKQWDKSATWSKLPSVPWPFLQTPPPQLHMTFHLGPTALSCSIVTSVADCTLWKRSKRLQRLGWAFLETLFLCGYASFHIHCLKWPCGISTLCPSQETRTKKLGTKATAAAMVTDVGLGGGRQKILLVRVSFNGSSLCPPLGIFTVCAKHTLT